MRKVHFISLTILTMTVLLPSFILNGTSINVSKEEDPPIIHFYKDSLDCGGGPRTQNTCPFFAEYETGNVLLGSTSSIGIVTVEVSSTAGDYYVSFFDTFDREILLPVSGNPGYYLLRIAVSSNEHYIGRFEL